MVKVQIIGPRARVEEIRSSTASRNCTRTFLRECIRPSHNSLVGRCNGFVCCIIIPLPIDSRGSLLVRTGPHHGAPPSYGHMDTHSRHTWSRLCCQDDRGPLVNCSSQFIERCAPFKRPFYGTLQVSLPLLLPNFSSRSLRSLHVPARTGTDTNIMPGHIKGLVTLIRPLCMSRTCHKPSCHKQIPIYWWFFHSEENWVGTSTKDYVLYYFSFNLDRCPSSGHCKIT